MAEEFEDRDLSDAVFWGVDLSGATFRDVNLTRAKISHAWLVDVEIDALVQRVMINGVDVTDYVNEHDQWYPLRTMLRPGDPEGMQAAWQALHDTWESTIERARPLADAQLRTSVDGEWSFLQTLRHLVFAMDKWFTVPVLGEAFHPAGLPNSGSADFPWPGLDAAADPSVDGMLALRAERSARFGEYLQTVGEADLNREVEVLENGVNPIRECVYTVFEEEFEHHRYVVRDLATFG